MPNLCCKLPMAEKMENGTRGKYPAAKPVEAAFGESIPAIKLRMHNLQG